MSTEAALAIVNARVWTNDPRRPWADAILVRAERIEVVGSSAEVKKRASVETRTIDAQGMTVVPGVIVAESAAMQAIYAAINRHANPDAATATEIGMLRPGMIADLSMLDRDLARIAPEMIRDARVVLTVSGGVVFDLTNTTP